MNSSQACGDEASVPERKRDTHADSDGLNYDKILGKIRIGTDCSGLDAPLQAMQHIFGVSFCMFLVVTLHAGSGIFT